LKLVPFEKFQADIKTNYSCNQEGEEGDDHVGEAGSLNEYASNAVGKHGEGEYFDKANCPVGEVVVAEKDS